MAQSATMGKRLTDAVSWEEDIKYSREACTVLSGQNLLLGAVVGKVLAGSPTSAPFAGNTGDGAMGAVTLGDDAMPGIYKVVITEPATNAGAFVVEDPNGVIVGTGNVAAAFAGPINFTLADGSTDFVVGDGFNITVAAGSSKVKEYNPTNTDGSGVVAGILIEAVDASAADKASVIIVRQAIAKKSGLTWFSGASAGQKAQGIAELAARGIIVRDDV